MNKKILKKIICSVLCIMLVVTFLPTKTYAKLPSGASVTKNANTYDKKTGKYDINYTIKNNSSSTIYVTNIKLVDKNNKSKATWKNRTIKSKTTSTTPFRYDFSKLSTGKYTLKFTISYWYSSFNSYMPYANYSYTVNHNNKVIRYTKSTYTTDTNGNRKYKVGFRFTEMKGLKPKYTIYNSKGKKMESFTGSTLTSNDVTKYVTCDGFYNDTMQYPSGTYTFKAECGGTSKSINIKCVF